MIIVRGDAKLALLSIYDGARRISKRRTLAKGFYTSLIRSLKF